MGMLIEGRWTTKWYEPDDDGHFVRPDTEFHHRVSADSNARHSPQSGRYHLYIARACPWAHRVAIMRRLKGLEDAISMSIVDTRMGDDGWEFTGRDGTTRDPIHSASYLHQVYTAADGSYTGRVTVPVLWDTTHHTIVNNESREIARMLDHAFVGVAGNDLDFAPPDLRDGVERAIDAIYDPINNGVYRAGFATSQQAYEEAYDELFAALDHWDGVLAGQRYMCGDTFTEADIFLFTTLVRFDAVYHFHFKCNRQRIADFEHLSGFLRDVYQMPGIAETVKMGQIKEHYFWSHPTVNPTRIVPKGPRLDFDAPHGRDHLDRAPQPRVARA